MTESFIKLEQDNDIVMWGKDTFTVSRLKELMALNMRIRLFKTDERITQHCNIPLANFLCDKDLTVTDQSIKLQLREFRLVFPLNGTECQLLQLKSGQWISGKIRFQADAVYGQNTVNVELEFAADEIISNEEDQNNINYDNSLDKIRAELNEMKAI
jgi:KGK domain